MNKRTLVWLWIVHRLPVPVVTQGVPNVQIVLTSFVPQIEIVRARLGESTFCVHLAWFGGKAKSILTTSVRARRLAVNDGIADFVIRTELVWTASLCTILVLYER